MALNFSISKGTRPGPQIVSPARLRQISGNSMALAYTVPRTTRDLTAVSFKQQRSSGTIEFTFDSGTLGLSLHQDVYIANDLTPCEQMKWAVHEQHHVSDNRDVMDQMPTEIMNYNMCKSLFQRGDWYPSSDFAMIQRQILEEIGNAFRDLTAQRVRALDTRAEYARVNREILRDCPGPIIFTVYRGDTLSGIANFYYGNQMQWKKIYDANRAVIGRNPNHLRIGLRLTIPK
ncbi:MAG: LysM peptidoglycan-binding domain-containing protein [Planctomycetaceae bacterium]